MLLSCCVTKSDEEAVEEADDWSDTIPSSASASHGLDSARSASASVMRLEVGAGATPVLKKAGAIHSFSIDWSNGRIIIKFITYVTLLR